jgi:dTDP-4-dehydrorhamnose 3,5-epimerase
MKFTETTVKGAFVIEPRLIRDERGFFARTFCATEFAEHGLDPRLVQSSIAFNPRAGTLRGMHYQVPPAGEPKVVRCLAGRIFDVIIDLRPDSPSYLSHFGLELSSTDRRALYIPELVAHGYLTLEDDTEVSYQMAAFYAPEYARGVRYNDPAFAIHWPRAVTCINQKDAAWPLFDRRAAGAA